LADRQSALNDRYLNGELSKDEYEKALATRSVRPWGATGDPRPPVSHMSF
jgi:hypothetical protein